MNSRLVGCFPRTCSSAIWKGVTFATFDILKEADWMLFQASVDKFCYVPTIFLYVLLKNKYWCVPKSLCDIIWPLDMK